MESLFERLNKKRPPPTEEATPPPTEEAKAVSLFERLDKGRRLWPTEEAIKKPRKQPRRSADLKALLMDVLTSGPVPATIIEERGAAHGFSKKQLYCAKRQMNIVAFKEVGRVHGRWFWALPQHTTGYPGAAGNT